jgi:hypothetical protein
MQIKTKEFKFFEIKVEEGVDQGSGIKDSLMSNVLLQGGTLLLCHVV